MPLEVFYSYSHKDAALRDELDVHLALLVRDGLIVPWADRRIEPGSEWRTEIDQHIHSAQIIILLISPSFVASDYCYGVEMKIALERHAREHAIVIPIILCPVDWQSAPFAELQALPPGGKPVTLWENRDEAFAEIAKAIRGVVIRFQQPAAPKLEPAPLLDQRTASARMLDAAMPSHVAKGRATELLVLIRLPDSEGLKGVLQQDDEAEARPEDVRSKPFDVTFPRGPTGKPEPLKVAVQLTSPDFQPASQTKNIFIPVDGDSATCSFMLTPLKTGSLMVVIELLWEDAERGSRRLKTTCIAESEMPANPSLNVVRMELRQEEPRAFPVIALPQIPPPVMAVAPPAMEAAPASRMGMPEPPPPPPPSRQTTRLSSSPILKMAVALCAVLLGSTFFFLHTPAPPAASAPAPPMATALEGRLDAAAAELNNASKVPAETPVMAETIRKGQENLAAARLALAKGNRVEARKRVVAVEAASTRLRELQSKP